MFSTLSSKPPRTPLFYNQNPNYANQNAQCSRQKKKNPNHHIYIDILNPNITASNKRLLE